jgi:NTE family protein
MRALVLSGAGNFGAMQAGAMEPLLETGFRPELIVGTSAGALNGLLLATDPTPDGARRAQIAWQQVSLREIATPGLLGSVRRLVTNRDSLVPSVPLARYVARSLGMDLETFGQLEARCGVQARAIAVCVETGELVAFGDRKEDRLIDGAMSSTAVPPFLAPWRTGGRRYFDGGVRSKLPVLAAIQRGATQILAVDVVGIMGGPEEAHGMMGIAGYAISMGIDQMTGCEIEVARRAGVELHLLQLRVPADIAFWDYSHAERLVEAGRQAARAWLEATPLRFKASWQVAFQVWLAGTGRQMERLAGG